MIGPGIAETAILGGGLLLVGAVVAVAALLLTRRKPKPNPEQSVAPGPSAGNPWAAGLNRKRERYREEQERILSMVAQGKITAEEAERLFESLERETATMDCPHCGGEVRTEAIKCRHCKRWLVDEASPGKKRFTRSQDKVLAGVCGGIAEYFDLDPTLIRLLTAVVVFFSGIITGLIVYLIAALIVPEKG